MFESSILSPQSHIKMERLSSGPHWVRSALPFGKSKTFGFFAFRATAGPQRRGKSLRINFWTTPEKLSKRPENGFFDPEYGQNDPLRGLKFDQKFYFRGHLSTFRAENTPESWSFKAKNNAQTTPEQLQTNFQNVQKTTFFGPKMVKMTLSEGQILT